MAGKKIEKNTGFNLEGLTDDEKRQLKAQIEADLAKGTMSAAKPPKSTKTSGSAVHMPHMSNQKR